MKIKTKGFTKEEIRQAARIQIEELNEGFLSSFGEKALTVIFSHIAQSTWGVLVIAVDSELRNVVGYVFGTLNTGSLYKEFLLKKTPAAIFYFLPKMLSVRRIIKAFETLIYPSKSPAPDLPDAELLDLAVKSQYHGTCVAQRLFEAFIAEFSNRGIDSFKIPTSASLPQAHRFYEKVGAKKVASVEVHEGEITYIYQYDIDSKLEQK